MAAEPLTVPFWLQVLTISLAPFLGFIGIAVGAYLQAKSNRKLALRAHRQDVYIHFLEAVHAFATHAGVYIEPNLRRTDHVKLNRHLDEFSQLARKVRDIYLQVEVIGSPSAIRASRRLQAYVAAVSSAMVDSALQEHSEEVWKDIEHLGLVAIRSFVDAASRDLGVRSWRKVQVSVTDFERELHAKGRQQLEYLNEQLKKEWTAASSTKDNNDE